MADGNFRTSEKVFYAREWLLCGAILLMMAGSILFLVIDAREMIKHQTEEFLSTEAVKYANTKKRIESIFEVMYKNIRVISLMPEVRHIQGGNLKKGERSAVELGRFTETDRNAIQQIYNNLAAIADVSEVYCVLDGFSRKRGETPFFMYDELILKTKSGFVEIQTRENEDEPEEYEEDEYNWFEANIPTIKGHHPVFNFENIDTIPAYISNQIRTCDNTQYVSREKGDVRNTFGLIAVVPFYNYAEQFRGVIAAIIRSNVFEAALLEVPFIPVLEEEVRRASREGWRLPADPGHFLLINEEAGIKIFDRRNTHVLAMYPSIGNGDRNDKTGKKYFRETLQEPFEGKWELFYLLDQGQLTEIRNVRMTPLMLECLGVIVIGLLFMGWVWQNAKLRSQAFMAELGEVMRKKTEELKKAKDFFENILNSMTDGVSVVDLEGRIKYLNKPFLDLFGTGAIGRICYDVYSSEHKQCDLCPPEI